MMSKTVVGAYTGPSKIQGSTKLSTKTEPWQEMARKYPDLFPRSVKHIVIPETHLFYCAIACAQLSLQMVPKAEHLFDDILTQLAEEGQKGRSKKFVVHFLEGPAELQGGGKLEKLILEKNELTGEVGNQKAKGTGQKTEMKCDIFFRSVGYSGIPIEGVPFHEDWGVFDNENWANAILFVKDRSFSFFWIPACAGITIMHLIPDRYHWRHTWHSCLRAGGTGYSDGKMTF